MNDQTLVLTESQSARISAMAEVTNDRATEALNKAKALVMASWQGTGIATTEQMAIYYEVPVDTAQTVIKNNRDELESDGLKKLNAKEIKALRSQGLFDLNIPEKTTVLTIWTPRAALRLGMLLRDSEIAKQVRTVILNIAVTPPPVEFEVRTVPRLIPVRDAVDYIQAADTLAKLPDSRLTRLLNQRLVDEVALVAVNQKQIAPAIEQIKQYTTATVRASQLGYSAKQIGNGASLGKFVKVEIAPEFSDWQGQYMVNHFEVSDRLDSRIHAFFLTRSL